MTVGVLGGGQLGRMLALAGYPLGHTFKFFDTSADSPVAGLGELVTGEYDDAAALARFADGLDVVTYEFENIPVSTAQRLSSTIPLSPPSQALKISQDRLLEKTFFASLGIPTAAYVETKSREDLMKGTNLLHFPCVLKTRTSGYDGKGQFILRNSGDIDRAWQYIKETPSLLEEWVPFQRELSVLAVRSKGGQVAFYSLTENVHWQGILRTSRSPATEVSEGLSSLAQTYALKVLDALQFVGVLAIELFQSGEKLIANEMAPRVHNSGHWTIEGAETSQFENHIRAICGMPLGSVNSRGYAAMVNIIGSVPHLDRILELPGVHLHLYGKQPRVNRKLGHITLRFDRQEILEEHLEAVQRLTEASV